MIFGIQKIWNSLLKIRKFWVVATVCVGGVLWVMRGAVCGVRCVLCAVLSVCGVICVLCVVHQCA